MAPKIKEKEIPVTIGPGNYNPSEEANGPHWSILQKLPQKTSGTDLGPGHYNPNQKQTKLDPTIKGQKSYEVKKM